MMKNKIIKLAAPVLMCFAGNLYADTTYTCTLDDSERVISVNYDNQDMEVPCEVRYKKEGEAEMLWRAEAQAGYCEEKAELFVQKQTGWGWACMRPAMQTARQRRFAARYL